MLEPDGQETEISMVNKEARHGLSLRTLLT
jgi:hypothetical protein